MRTLTGVVCRAESLWCARSAVREAAPFPARTRQQPRWIAPVIRFLPPPPASHPPLRYLRGGPRQTLTLGSQGPCGCAGRGGGGGWVGARVEGTHSCDSPTKMVSAAVSLRLSTTHASSGRPASLSIGLGMVRPACANRSPEPPMGMSTFIPSGSPLAAGAASTIFAPHQYPVRWSTASSDGERATGPPCHTEQVPYNCRSHTATNDEHVDHA
jgi:hypothetical protein